ncbi:unnamed protein product, partial [marine sediment metagenome]
QIVCLLSTLAKYIVGSKIVNITTMLRISWAVVKFIPVKSAKYDGISSKLIITPLYANMQT